MNAPSLDGALQRYAEALDDLDQKSPDFSSNQVIAVLLARNEVFELLPQIKDRNPDVMLLLVQLDERLKHHGEAIAQTIDLPAWRDSLKPPDTHWWWGFQAPQIVHPRDRIDWLWSALSIACLTGALSLLGDISSRFLSGGPDTFGAIAISVQGVLTALAGGGALTRVGKESTQHVLMRLNIPRYLWAEVTTAFSGLVLIMLIGFRLALPILSSIYKESGINHYNNGNFTSATLDYERALKLHPNNAEANYWLGRLNEELNESQVAQNQYQIAVQANFVPAFNNLARLYILSGKNEAAVSLLLRGQELTSDPQVRLFMNKNLGWARFNQQRYPEAEAALLEARAFAAEAGLGDRADISCLLAQVYDALQEPAPALQEWELCLTYANPQVPEEDGWLNMARRKLAAPEAYPSSPQSTSGRPAQAHMGIA